MTATIDHPSTIDLPAVADEDIGAFWEFEDLWAVIVWNDDVTTFQTVIEAFVEIFGHTVEQRRPAGLEDPPDRQGGGGSAAQGRGRGGRARAARAQDLGHALSRLARGRPPSPCRAASGAFTSGHSEATMEKRGRRAHGVVGARPVGAHDPVELPPDAFDGGP